MANSLGSNYGKKVAEVIAAGFEGTRVTTKTIDTQSLQGMHNSSTGDTVYTKRAPSYKARETATGDISSGTNNGIYVGQIASTVQDIVTVKVDWNTVEEALELNQLDELLAPIGEEVCTRIELNTNDFMLKNAALSYGTPGTVVDAWSDVAGAGAMMDAIGVPMQGKRYYQMDPFTKVNLAGAQTGLSANGKVNSAWENAVVTDQLGGMTALTSNCLSSYTSGSAADRVGAIEGVSLTWEAHKDTMKQTLSVSGFSASSTIKAGEQIRATGVFHVNPRTRQILTDSTGASIEFTWTVVEDVTLDAAGEGDVLVTNAAILDPTTNGQFDNISATPAGAVITILGSADTAYKPNMFYHKSAFTIASIQLPKLSATDVIYKTKDGISLRMTRYANEDANQNNLRVDAMYALGVTNPLFAGKAFGL